MKGQHVFLTYLVLVRNDGKLIVARWHGADRTLFAVKLAVTPRTISWRQNVRESVGETARSSFVVAPSQKGVCARLRLIGRVALA